MTAMPEYWPWMLGGVVTLALTILFALVQLLRKASKVQQLSVPDDEEDAPPPPPPKDAPKDPKPRAQAALRRARSRLTAWGIGDKYATPLVLLLGAEGSRDAGFLEHTAGAGLTLQQDMAAEGLALASGRELLFFHDGVVLDVAGEAVLGSDGEHADDGAWQRIVGELLELRPKRPLDGLVVTVGCHELLDAAGSEAARTALGQRAARVRDRLWDLQQRTGFRLPLYLLVTSCDLLDGFAETYAALPEALRGQILGWSSPYGGQAPYQTKWIDEASREMREVLDRLQMELFRAGAHDGGVLLFPRSLSKLAEPLRRFLDVLLAPSARHETSMARGIYFCGAVENRTAFAAELFTEKIFPEAGMAMPVSSLRMTRSRRARALRIVTAVVAVAVVAGLVLAAARLDERRPLVIEVLNQSAKAMNAAENDALGDAAAKLLMTMAKIDFDHVSPAWLPASWFAFDDRFQTALGHAFGKVVLSAVARNLGAETEQVTSQEAGRIVDPGLLSPADPVNLDDMAAEPLEAVPHTAEFLRLNGYVTQMRELERLGTMFQYVAETGSGDEATLATLVNHSLHKNLPLDFFRRRSAPHKNILLDFFRAPVPAFTTDARFDRRAYVPNATEGARRDVLALYAKVFDRNPSVARVASIARYIDQAHRAADTGQFEILHARIHDLQKDLSAPALEWAFRSRLDLGPDFDQVLASIDSSAMFEKGTAPALRECGEEELRGMQRRLAARTQLDAPVLKLRADGTPVMELSRETDMVHVALEAFLGQNVAVPDGAERSIRTPGARERLQWNLAEVDQAAGAYRAYTEFRDKGIKLFPALQPKLAQTIEQSWQQRTRLAMAGYLAAAQQIEPVMGETARTRDDEVRGAAAAFEASAKALRPRLDELQLLRAERTRDDAIAANSAEAARLLRAVDRLLEQAAPYQPRVMAWDGADTTPAAPAVWGQREADDVAVYVDRAREQVAALDGYAKPMLDWLNDFGVSARDAELADRWRSIDNDLKTYKRPGNAAAMLEDYIVVRTAKVTLDTCGEAELKRSEAEARGYFGVTLRSAANAIARRCSERAAGRAAKEYAKVEELFGKTLAGRYPFGGDPSGIQAEPEDLRRFFKQFDELRPHVDAVSKEAVRYDVAWFKPAADFVAKMSDVRTFFATFLDPAKKMTLPEVNVDMAFRVPPELPGGANEEIIRRSLALGADVVESGSGTQREKTKKPLQWRPGTPVTLTLQWAADSERVPLSPAEHVSGRAIVYRYTNRWSLLAALDDLRATGDDFVDADAQPVTLAIAVASGLPDRKPGPPAKLFLRMSLTGGDGKTLVVPNFRDAAPAPLGRSLAEALP